jgi:hypothetical protein
MIISIADLIRDLMYSDFLGRENAKPRSILLGRIRIHIPGMKDRTMRRIYGKTMLVGWVPGKKNKEGKITEGGIYVIDSIPEVEKMIRTETRRKDSIGDKIEMLKGHRRFLIARERERQSGQMRLPL